MNRIVEIDFLKGLAVICMMISHLGVFGNITVKNLIHYKKFKFNLNLKLGNSKIFHFIGVISHIIFIILVGVNMVSSYHKTVESKEKMNKHTNKDKIGNSEATKNEDEDMANNDKEKHVHNFRKRNQRRALIIIAYGVVMSLLARVFFGKWYILFGIFQFIGVSILIAVYFVEDYNIYKIILALLFILIATSVKSSNSSTLYHFLIGKTTDKFMDYFPLIPYFAYVLVGIVAGKCMYKKIDLFNDTFKYRSLNTIAKIGRKALPIYFGHLIVLFVIVRLCVRKSVIHI